jgi:hypothetical protein
MKWVRPGTVRVEAAALCAMVQVYSVGLLDELGLIGPQRLAAQGSIIGFMEALCLE